MKKNINRTSIVLLSVLIISGFGIILSGSVVNNIAYASTIQEGDDLEMICSEYTDTLYLHGEDQKKSNCISLYESYLDNRFEFGNRNNQDPDIIDEWIFKIVPIQLFERQVEDFLYIGKRYGFYVDYNASGQNYLVYLLLHDDTDEISGQYARKIKPFYYERYRYDGASRTASLLYRSTNGSRYYEKYSDVKNLYIKNVGFTGSLYNENHVNYGEKGYAAEADYGGYFFGNYYKFKGVSAQSGKSDFYADTFKTLIGYIPLSFGISVGDAFNVADVLTSLVELGIDATHDFRGDITNETDYGYQFEDSLAQSQLDKNGYLSKVGGAILETDNDKDGLLFGIKQDCYIQNTFFIAYRNQDDMWNTRFSGKISLDIAEEDSNTAGSTVRNIATGVESLNYIKSFDNGEKTEIHESEAQNLYLLADVKHNVRFEAPITGTYTFKTQSEVVNEIFVTKGTVTDAEDGINKKLVVNLEQTEIFDLCITKNDINASAVVNVLVEFTPDEIKIGQTKQLEIQAGKREYLLFIADRKATPFEFDVSAQGEVSLQLAFDKHDNYMPNVISGSHLYGSRLAEYKGKYYLIVSNNASSPLSVSMKLTGVESVSPNDRVNESIIDVKVYEFSSTFTSSMKISLRSEAPILMQAFDAEHNLLAWTSEVDQKQFFCSVESGDKYYLVLRNLLYTNYDIELAFELSTYKLKIGENEITKKTNGFLMEFPTGETSAIYQIQSAGIACTVYDEGWQTLDANAENEFMLEANKSYFIYADGPVQAFELNISIVTTNDMSGVFTDWGMVFIKYIPTRTTAYKVIGTDTYEWYSETLIKHNAYLYKDETYYLKVSGAFNDEYSVDIARNANQIQPDSSVSLGSGYYFFYITKMGNYTIWVTCLNEISTMVTLSDGFGNALINDLRIANESRQIYLKEGLYYFDLNVVNGNTASVRINLTE